MAIHTNNASFLCFWVIHIMMLVV